MSHLNKVIARVDATIEESVITHMNELLIELSDDAELSREDRYTQQQRLRTAIAHHGKQHKEEAEARHAHLTQGGTILWVKTGAVPPAGANHQHHCAADRANQRAQGMPLLLRMSITRPPISWLATSTAMVVAAPTF